MVGDIVFEAVDGALTRPLRAAVLRPGRPASAVVMPLDDDPRALHVVARTSDGVLVATGSIHPEDRASGEQPGFRIRGMATHPEHRGRGLGTQVLERLLAHAEAHAGREVWCNARIGAATLYERAGFSRCSEVFDIEDIGLHFVMARSVGWGPAQKR